MPMQNDPQGVGAGASPGSGLPPETPVHTAPAEPAPREIGGPPGPEPTRFGDWEKNGRCIDF
jgi:hypothetical protein